MLIVKCIDNEDYMFRLTINKEYPVIKEYSLCYILIDDSKTEQSFIKERFEIVKQDKSVEKEYTLQEVINIIQDGEEYKNSDEIWIVKSIKKEDGYIKFYFEGEEIGRIGFSPQQRFIKVEQLKPVSFMEALASDKKCNVQSDIISKVYNKCSNSSYVQVDIIKNILDGKFDYINSIIYALSGYMGSSDWEELIKNGEFYLESEDNE